MDRLYRASSFEQGPWRRIPEADDDAEKDSLCGPEALAAVHSSLGYDTDITQYRPEHQRHRSDSVTLGPGSVIAAESESLNSKTLTPSLTVSAYDASGDADHDPDHDPDDRDRDQRLVGAEHDGDESTMSLFAEEKPKPEIMLGGTRKMLILAGMCCCWFTKGLDAEIIVTVAPELAKKYNALDLISWFSAAYIFPQASLSAGFGRLAAVMDPRILGGFASLLFIVGSVMCIVATDAIVFIVGRAVMGISVSAMVPMSSVLLTKITVPAERPMYIAFIVSTDSISLASGALLGGLFETKVDFRYAVGITMLLLLIGIALILLPLQLQGPVQFGPAVMEMLRTFDHIGFVLLLTSSLLSLIGLQLASQNEDWGSSGVIISLVVAGILFGMFIYQQAHYPDPDARLLPQGLFSRDVSLVLAMGTMVTMAVFPIATYLATYFQLVHQLDALHSGIALLGYLLAFGFAGLGTGFAMKYLDWANPVILFSTVVSIIGAALLVTFDENTPVLRASLMSIIAGIGGGVGQTLGIVFAQNWVAPRLQPLMISFATMVQLYGAALGVVMGGVLLNTQLHSRLRELGSWTADMLDNVLAALDSTGRINQILTKSQAQAVFKVAADSHRVVFYVILATSIMQFMFAIHIRKRKI